MFGYLKVNTPLPISGLCWVLDKVCTKSPPTHPRCAPATDRHKDGEVMKSIFTAPHTHTNVAMEAIPSIPQTNKLHRCRIATRRHFLGQNTQRAQRAYLTERKVRLAEAPSRQITWDVSLPESIIKGERERWVWKKKWRRERWWDHLEKLFPLSCFQL